jgi:hypothetical protein
MEAGATISRQDRPRWLGQLARSVYLSAAARVVALFLCNCAVRDDGKTDRWSVRGLALDVGLSEATIKNAMNELQRAGYLRIVSGRRSRRNNSYILTWPQPSAQTNLVFLRPPMDS